jgi:hypothetical protein
VRAQAATGHLHCAPGRREPGPPGMTMAGMHSPGRDDPARRSDAVDVQALPNDPAKPRAASRPSRPRSTKAARKHAETLLASFVNKSTPSVPHPSRAIPAGPCKQAPANLAGRRPHVRRDHLRRAHPQHRPRIPTPGPHRLVRPDRPVAGLPHLAARAARGGNHLRGHGGGRRRRPRLDTRTAHGRGCAESGSAHYPSCGTRVTSPRERGLL